MRFKRVIIVRNIAYIVERKASKECYITWTNNAKYKIEILTDGGVVISCMRSTTNSLSHHICTLFTKNLCMAYNAIRTYTAEINTNSMYTVG